jgi:hypothetical protein
MNNSARTIWEDDNYLYVPEDLFSLLPASYREAAEVRKKEGTNLLQIVNEDL